MKNQQTRTHCSALMSREQTADETEQYKSATLEIEEWLWGHHVLFIKSMFDGDAWLPGGREANIRREK